MNDLSLIAPATELATIEPSSLVAVFAQADGIESILTRIEADARAAALLLDVSKPAGRKAIASLAHKVARSKTALDDAGKDVKAEFKARVDAIDAERRICRERLDTLSAEVRKPLDDYEAAEAARIQGHEDALAEIGIMGSVTGLSAEQIGARVHRVPSVEVRDWQEFKARAESVTTATINSLKVALADAEKTEAAEAERAAREDAEAEQRIQEAARLKLEREERIAAEAAERGRLEAEAKAEADRLAAADRERRAMDAQARAEERARNAEAEQIAAEQRAAELAKQERIAADERAKRQADEAAAAERRRIEAEADAKRQADERRAADVAHRGKINNEALVAVMALGMEEALGKSLVIAIARGKIPHVSIAY